MNEKVYTIKAGGSVFGTHESFQTFIQYCSQNFEFPMVISVSGPKGPGGRFTDTLMGAYDNNFGVGPLIELALYQELLEGYPFIERETGRLRCHYSKRERPEFVSWAEDVSGKVLRTLFDNNGVSAIYCNGSGAGIKLHADGSPDIESSIVEMFNFFRHFDDYNVIIVGGFRGNFEGKPVLMDKGGTDLTNAMIANVLYRTSNAPEFIQEMDIKDVLETPMVLAMGHFTN